jgi:uncharacterized protein YndB with AHSA1/START domain
MTHMRADLTGDATDPVVVSVTVERTPLEAFHVFTAGLARWWPLREHSVSRARALSCALEPRAGGAVYEVRDDGHRFPWGRVREWDPPARLVLSWHPGHPPQAAQEVEVRFDAEGGGARVEIEHRGWARLGARAAEARESYDRGWRKVLGTHFAAACRLPLKAAPRSPGARARAAAAGRPGRGRPSASPATEAGRTRR